MDVYKITEVREWLASIAGQPNIYTLPFRNDKMQLIKAELEEIARDIQKEERFFFDELQHAKLNLFTNNGYIRLVSLGRTIEILTALQNQYANKQDGIWAFIHPQIAKVSKQLYLDGHYADAACDAFIEVNDRVKQIYIKQHPNAADIPDGQSLMNKVFADSNPVLQCCELTSDTGENIQKGTRFMLSGAMAALRNPKAHANITISAEDAMRRLMFASLLMYQIDEAVCFSQIDEHK